MTQSEMNHMLFEAVEYPDGVTSWRVTYYLQQGADYKAHNAMGDTPLTLAAGCGYMTALRALLAFETDRHVNVTAHDGMNALMMAMREMPKNFRDVATTLIDAGINLDHKDIFKKTVKDYAAKGGWRDRNEKDAVWLHEKIAMIGIDDIAVKKFKIPKAVVKPRKGGPKR